MNMLSSKNYLLLILLFTLLIQTNCSKKDTAEQNSRPPKETRDSLVITLSGIDDLNVLEVLEKKHKTNTVSSAMGTFVKGIDDIENNSNTFWFFSVNGVMAKEAADNIMTQDSDTIVWYFRQIGVETSDEDEQNLSDSL